jgi:hypothetical protein
MPCKLLPVQIMERLMNEKRTLITLIFLMHMIRAIRKISVPFTRINRNA